MSHHDHHHHTPEEQLLEDALAFSYSCEGTHPDEISLEDLKASIVQGLQQIAARLAEDGVLYGHVKALLSWKDCTNQNGRLAFSVTHLGETDQTILGTSPTPNQLIYWKMTVNVISLWNTTALQEDDLEKFFPKFCSILPRNTSVI